MNGVNNIFVIKDLRQKDSSSQITNKGSKALMKINELQSVDEDENITENQDYSSIN